MLNFGLPMESDTMSVLALDIETKNIHEIGGFGNTHMFQVSTVATWDGNTGTVYVDEKILSLSQAILLNLLEN